MSGDNTAIVNTSLISSVLLRTNGIAISKNSVKETKGLFFTPSALSKNIVSTSTSSNKGKFVISGPISTQVAKNNISLKTEITATSTSISDSSQTTWSMLSSRTVNVTDTKLIKYPTLNLVTSTNKVMIVDRVSESRNIVYENGISISRDLLAKPENEEYANFTLAQSTLAEEKMIINEGFALIDDYQGSNLFANATLKSASIVIEDYKPPNIGGSLVGGGLKSIMIVAQKMSFFEMNLSFTQGKVVSVSSLPLGLVFESGRIKGSPVVSGYFPILIELDNGAKIEGIINIAHVQRQL